MEVAKVSYQDPKAAEKFTRSLKETGFAVVSDHPISHPLIFETFKDWEGFFNSPTKFDYLFNPQKQSGYFPFKSENAKDHKVKDLKEFYHLYKGEDLPSFLNDRSWRLFDELNSLAATMLGWVQDSTPAEVVKTFSQPLREMIADSSKTLFRIIHYPPLSGDEEAGAIRAAAHEDINLITLLPAATAPGLQVLDNRGRWHDVECDPGNIVVNSGDMLKMASGGYFGSTTHQVVNPSGIEAGKARYSMPLFLHPRPEVKLSQTHTAESYLLERLREIGLK
jgi:isopenicillin N synthase-like dioxygenase